MTYLLAFHEMRALKQAWYEQAEVVQTQFIDLSLDSLSREDGLFKLERELDVIRRSKLDDSTQVRMIENVSRHVDDHLEKSIALIRNRGNYLREKREMERLENDFESSYHLLRRATWVGFAMALTGGLLWYIKLQRHEDAIQRIAGLKASEELKGMTKRKT